MLRMKRKIIQNKKKNNYLSKNMDINKKYTLLILAFTCYFFIQAQTPPIVYVSRNNEGL
jgi:hypothetical protein